jgi:thioredoxin-related protein
MAVTVFGQSKINFETTTLADAQKKAAKEKKMIFMDVYADWCRPCHWLNDEVFTDPQVAKHFNTNFINFRIDAEKGDGIAVAKKYEVASYPSLVIIDAKGDIIHYAIGALPADELLAFAEDAKKPDVRLGTFIKAFNENPNGQTASNYFKALQRIGLQVDEKAATYFATLSSNKLATKENLDLLMAYPGKYGSSTFNLVLKQREQLNKTYAKNEVDSVITQVFDAAVLNMEFNEQSASNLTKIKNDVKTLKLPKENKVIWAADMIISEINQDSAGFVHATTSLLKTYYPQNAAVNYAMAESYSKKFTDKKLLAMAANWSKFAAEEAATDYAYWYLYADLNYRLDRKQEAERAVGKFREITKGANFDQAKVEELINAIKK